MKWLVEALKTPFWQFVVTSCLSILVGVMAIFFQWFLTRRRKELSYSLLTNTAIVNVREDYEERIEIRFLGRRVSSVRLIIFKLINNGHKAIVPDDYVESVVLRFAGDSRILSAAVVETDPPALKKIYAEDIGNSQGGEVTFPNKLLNSGDWLKLNILVSDFQGPVTVTGRIVDVKEIKEMKDLAGRKRLTFAGLFFTGVILSLLLPPPFDAILVGLVVVTTIWLSLQRRYFNSWLPPHRD